MRVNWILKWYKMQFCWYAYTHKFWLIIRWYLLRYFENWVNYYSDLTVSIIQFYIKYSFYKIFYMKYLLLKTKVRKTWIWCEFFFFFFYGSISVEIYRMAIGRFSPWFTRHWTHVIFHAELSDDYKVAMTNFAETRDHTSPDHDKHPHDNRNKSNCAAERTFYKRIKTHTHKYIHICYTRWNITHSNKYLHVYRIIWQELYFYL